MDKPDVELELEHDKNGAISKIQYKKHIDNKESSLEFCAIIQAIFGYFTCPNARDDELPEYTPDVNKN